MEYKLPALVIKANLRQSIESVFAVRVTGWFILDGGATMTGIFRASRALASENPVGPAS